MWVSNTGSQALVQPALLYETLRVACFHARVASRREVVRHGSTPLTSRSVTTAGIASFFGYTSKR
ncbi:hypothetical protein COO91_03055 [Nostoc flagelliforme CCNUN1]|uniref:Uncharacterized protein n=1 Tax=Nostoc flagelliforme CCNUN1 TaxID=2038116 RepID=A0A2K8SNV7_9NOSO|nr:hypothetical protein [Nostoc flagelliforme]AUB37119.1 hypothetical protein COO91_03055 [Nostoc flagelliforme CCNUN1]